MVDGAPVLVGSLRFLREADIDVSNAEARVRTWEEEGKTVVGVAARGRLVGLLSVADEIKEDAAEAICRLKRLGIGAVMITGDNEPTARAVAGRVGISEVEAQVSPQDKAARVHALQEQGYRVAMVGDGINDAPALMQADVGIAIGAGTDIAIESSDVIIVGDRLSAVVDAFHVGSSSFRKTVQNLGLAFSFNGVGVPAAVTGLVHPIWAMVASVSTVLLNSFGGRLLPKPPIAPPPETLEKIEQINVKVPSMHCVGCADNLERAIGKIPGVRSVHADLRKKLLTVAMRDGEVGRKEICSAITTIGHICGARIYWESHYPRYPGLSGGGMALNFRDLIHQKDEVIQDYRDKKYQSILQDSDRITVYRGHAAFSPDGTATVDGRRLVGRQYLIATGSRPVIPLIEGLDTVPYLTSDLLTSEESPELWDLPGSLIIIGGGYIALELGQMFQRFGTSVTIIERSARMLPGYEPEVSLAIQDVLEGERVTVVTDTTVRRVWREGGGVAVVGETHGVERQFTAERLLVATGRVPNTDAIGLPHVGVKTDGRGAVVVNDYLQTTNPHIWAAGDVIGAHTGSQLATPVGAHDGVIAASNALNGEQRTVDHTVIPRTIFTDPQIAVVGLTDEEANQRGVRCNCGTVPMRLVPRAGAVRDPRGLIKMVLDWDSKRVLGVSMVGRDAGEVIHEAAMAMRFRATAHDFIDMVYVYPTMAEALKIAALSFFKDVEKLSCCAE